MKIAVRSTDYVGLVSGTCFAETGNDVICVDIDHRKVDMLTGGQITIFEPGLEILFIRNLKEGRLWFTTQLENAVKEAQVVFLALPTPPGEGGADDLNPTLGESSAPFKVFNFGNSMSLSLIDYVRSLENNL